MIQLTSTLKMTTAQVIKMSVTVNNGPIQDYILWHNNAQPAYIMPSNNSTKITAQYLFDQITYTCQAIPVLLLFQSIVLQFFSPLRVHLIDIILILFL